MNRAAKIILILLVFLAFLAFVLRSTSTDPVAVLRVVDTAGQPIAGAIIRPDGMRPKRINGHWGWSDRNKVKPLPVTTDAHGFARVPYPRYVFEKAETGEISFSVEHPDYCSERPFRVVSITPPPNASLKDKAAFVYALVTRQIVTRPDPVVLKRGGIVKVSGYLGSKTNLLPGIRAQLASMPVPHQGWWQSVNSTTLANRRVPEGSNAVRLIYFPPTGKICFSDPTNFSSVPGQTNEFCLELKPGFQLGGHLDDSVPRPVAHGSIQIKITSPDMNTNGNHFLWQASQEINPDGTFRCDSLPSGKVEIIALCDGFKSKDAAGPKSISFLTPQIFKLENQDLNAVVDMEPTAALEVTVLDDRHQPLPGASVSIWPNVLWNGRGSTIFMGPTFSTEDLFRSGEDFNWQNFRETHPQNYLALTDQRGIATVPNLPAFKQRFSIDHTNYELPINPVDNEREAWTQLLPRETNHTTITLQRKGAQFLQSPR